MYGECREMVRFLYSKKNADAEEVLENINKYILLGVDDFELERFETYKKEMLGELDGALQRVNATWYVSVYRQIVAGNKIKSFIKRVIRKFVSWILIDITDQQMEFNRAVTDCANRETQLLQLLVKENEKLKEENEKLQKSIMECKKEASDEN